MPLLDHFGILAPFYDYLIQVKNVDRLAKLARLPVQGWLLDAGGGTGRVAHALGEMVTQSAVVDLSFRMLLHASGKQGIQATNAHIEALPFVDGAFERIIMVDALHHVCDQAKSAAELWRVLKPGGSLVIEEPDVRTIIVKVVAAVEKLALMRSHFLPPSRIIQLFDSYRADISFEREGYNAWIVVEKRSDV